MKRRGFLALLAGAVLDPERLLWVPGAKLISIPKPAAALDPQLFLSIEEFRERYVAPMLTHWIAQTEAWIEANNIEYGLQGVEG